MTTDTRTLTSYGPVQMGDRLGLARFQVDRALAAGLIPLPDRARWRWSAGVVDGLADRADEIRAAVGAVPDLGASRAAEELSTRLRIAVTTDAVVELAARGCIPVVGEYKDYPLYCGRTIEQFTDTAAAVTATEDGELLTADQATGRLGVRRSDFDHLTRTGLLQPTTYGRSSWQPRRSAPAVPLYRAGDLTALLTRDGIDWDAVRATPKGHPSPLAKLPTKETTS
jgi:hypothetical protein